MKDALTLYKLIILYMLDQVDFPLTKAQLCDFILDKEYTTFMTLQQVIGELIDAKLINAQSYRNRTHLKLTKEGRDAIHFFSNDLNPEIKKDIEEFFEKNSIEMRNDVSIKADYYKTTNGDYESKLIAMDKDTKLIELTMTVPIEETAQSICDNWNKKNQEIYQYLVKQLF